MPGLPVHVTASAVVLAPDGDRALLLRHPRFGRWGPLGGHVEVGESPADAVRREVVEESGLTAVRVLVPRVDLTVDAVDCGRGDGLAEHRDHVFAVVADPGGRRAPEAGLRLAWFGVAALPDPLVPGLAGWLETAVRAVAAARS